MKVHWQVEGKKEEKEIKGGICIVCYAFDLGGIAL